MFDDMSETPPINEILIAECPEWCDEGYQVCKWNGREFSYNGQPNDLFHGYVTGWRLL